MARQSAKPWLLDVNVLVALAWPSHVHHAAAIRWFERHRSEGFRTCPLTQLGFVRVSSNARAIAGAVQVEDASRLLERIVALPGHGFWPDDLAWSEIRAAHGPISGHQQVTDAYLLALAAKHHGRMITLDRSVPALRGAAGIVELLDPGA